MNKLQSFRPASRDFRQSFTCLLLFLSASLLPAATPNLLVRVSDFTLTAPVASQPVRLEPRNTASAVGIQRGTTDSSGSLTISNLPSGRYTLFLPASGISDLILELPNTAGTLVASDYVITEGWTAPTTASAKPVGGSSYLLAPPNAAGALTNDGSGVTGWLGLENFGGASTGPTFADVVWTNNGVAFTTTEGKTNNFLSYSSTALTYLFSSNHTIQINSSATPSGSIPLGDGTTAIGYSASSGSVGDYNTTVGYGAMFAVNGTENTAAGYQALDSSVPNNYCVIV